MFEVQRAVGLLACALASATSMSAPPADAGSAAEINRGVVDALAKLYATVPEARPLGARAKGIPVFPSIVKAGFLFGAQYGEGALRQRDKTTGYYSTVAAAYGLQAGVSRLGTPCFS